MSFGEFSEKLPLTLPVSIQDEEQINLNFYFRTSLWWIKRFMKAFISIELSKMHGTGSVDWNCLCKKLIDYSSCAIPLAKYKVFANQKLKARIS